MTRKKDKNICSYQTQKHLLSSDVLFQGQNGFPLKKKGGSFLVFNVTTWFCDVLVLLETVSTLA